LTKEFKRFLATTFLPFFGALLMRFIYLTSRKTFHFPSNIPDERCIIASWHGDLLMQPFSYRKWRKEPKVVIMISEHFDGEIIAKIVAYFGLDTIRGSTRRGAARVLLQAIKKVKKEGYDLGITPDGPKGPRFSVGDGMVIVSQKADKEIVALNCIPSAYWQLGSWDKFVIPKPFCHLHFYMSEPFKVTDMSMDEAKSLIYNKLMINNIR
jgi:lysophospholipid acyltransferase (LPLAT)-like uncharacterized protein